MSDTLELPGTDDQDDSPDQQDGTGNALQGAAASKILPLQPTNNTLTEPQLEQPADYERRPVINRRIAERMARSIIAKNLADDMPDDERNRLAAQCKREFKIDDETRAEWKDHYREWLEMAMQIAMPKSYPWPNASNVIFPLISSAALQFNARAYPAIIQGRNVVKGTVIGDDRGVMAMDPNNPAQPMQGPDGKPVWIVEPGAKQQRADNIGRHMSWQLLSEMKEWETQTDRMLLIIAICGCMFRKTYFDVAERRNVSETVSALRVCVNYKAKSFATAPRITEEIDFYPWEIETNIRSGIWLDYGDEGYGRNQDGDTQDDQAPTTFCEQHRRWDLDGDGYDEPVIVTFARDSGKLARVIVGYDQDGIEATDDGEVQAIKPIDYYTQYQLVPCPDEGVYGVGFGHLLLPLNASINTSINQLFDAGHLQMAGGGFIGGGMSMNTGSIRFMMGEFKVLQTPGSQLKDNIVPMVFPGPNAALMTLLQYLVESAKDLASIKDILTGDLPGANVPGILGLAVIQQGLKVFNACFKRVHTALGHEFEKLFNLNRRFLPSTAGFRMGSEYFSIKRSDYELGGGVEPVSDPDMVTDVQQMAHANFLAQFLNDPFFDQREIRLRMLQAACTPQIDKLLAPQAPPNAEIATKLAELDLGKQQVQIQQELVTLRNKELDIRAAHQEADQDIKRGKDKATEIELLTRSIKNLADAKKSDNEVDQTWYGQQLENLRAQIEFLNVSSTIEAPGASPAAAAAGGSGA